MSDFLRVSCPVTTKTPLGFKGPFFFFHRSFFGETKEGTIELNDRRVRWITDNTGKTIAVVHYSLFRRATVRYNLEDLLRFEREAQLQKERDERKGENDKEMEELDSLGEKVEDLLDFLDELERLVDNFKAFGRPSRKGHRKLTASYDKANYTIAEMCEFLGISQDYTNQVLIKAYKTKALEHHPDKGGDEQQFKKLLFFYKFLKERDL